MGQTALVADIGGTNARFALADLGASKISAATTFSARDFASIDDAARAYLKSTRAAPQAACFAVAAPVEAERIDFTNSDWSFEKEGIRRALGLERLHIINDFYALAASVEKLGAEAFVEIKWGQGVASAPALVFGPGTGLGQALIVPTGDRRRIIATQGGHVAFAPQTEDEEFVRSVLERAHSRVSIERVLSGAGLVAVYLALAERRGVKAALAEPKSITTAAAGDSDMLARESVALFLAVLGSACGDAVLATGALGGVFLGGGILPKIAPLLKKSAFVERFLDKGRMRDYVATTPIRLIVEDGAALLGAAAALIDASH